MDQDNNPVPSTSNIRVISSLDYVGEILNPIKDILEQNVGNLRDDQLSFDLLSNPDKCNKIADEITATSLGLKVTNLLSESKYQGLLGSLDTIVDTIKDKGLQDIHERTPDDTSNEIFEILTASSDFEQGVSELMKDLFLGLQQDYSPDDSSFRPLEQDITLQEPQPVTSSSTRIDVIYTMFVMENITSLDGGRLNLNSSYTRFKEWFTDNFPTLPVHSKSKYKEEMDKTLGEGDTQCWLGYGLITDE